MLTGVSSSVMVTTARPSQGRIDGITEVDQQGFRLRQSISDDNRDGLGSLPGLNVSTALCRCPPRLPSPVA